MRYWLKQTISRVNQQVAIDIRNQRSQQNSFEDDSASVRLRPIPNLRGFLFQFGDKYEYDWNNATLTVWGSMSEEELDWLMNIYPKSQDREIIQDLYEQSLESEPSKLPEQPKQVISAQQQNIKIKEWTPTQSANTVGGISFPAGSLISYPEDDVIEVTPLNSELVLAGINYGKSPKLIFRQNKLSDIVTNDKINLAGVDIPANAHFIIDPNQNQVQIILPEQITFFFDGQRRKVILDQKSINFYESQRNKPSAMNDVLPTRHVLGIGSALVFDSKKNQFVEMTNSELIEIPLLATPEPDNYIDAQNHLLKIPSQSTLTLLNQEQITSIQSETVVWFDDIPFDARSQALELQANLIPKQGMLANDAYVYNRKAMGGTLVTFWPNGIPSKLTLAEDTGMFVKIFGRWNCLMPFGGHMRGVTVLLDNQGYETGTVLPTGETRANPSR